MKGRGNENLRLLLLVAEQAAVFGRMILGQGGDAILTVALDAEFFRRFLFHTHEPLMVFIVRQLGRCFRRSGPQKQEQAGTEQEKKGVVDHYFILAVYLWHILTCRSSWSGEITGYAIIMNSPSCNVNPATLTFPVYENQENSGKGVIRSLRLP